MHNGVTGAGQTAELMEDEASDGMVLAFGKRNAGLCYEVVNVEEIGRAHV